MSHVRQWFLAACGFALVLAVAPAQDQPVAKEWKGSVADEALQKDAPTVITNSKTLAKIWKDWKIEGKEPEVNFTQDMVVVVTSRGSQLKLITKKKGDDLQVLGLGTRDLAPGFRYVLTVASREGVKTVNGKELPRD